MNGWGSLFLTVAPDGTALPCHSARLLPIEFPNVTQASLEDIWYRSPGFNHYRGDGWMPEPCRSCDEKDKDFGGCRCQAYLLTGNADNRSEEHTSELQSRPHLVCRLLLEKKNNLANQPGIFDCSGHVVPRFLHIERVRDVLHGTYLHRVYVGFESSAVCLVDHRDVRLFRQ